MDEGVNDKTAIFSRNVSAGIGIGITFLGLVVLTGWILDITALKSILPNLVTMKANTSIAFIFSGLALILSATPADNKFVLSIGKVCAFAVLAIGLMTSCEYFFGINLGIDEVFFKEAATAVGTLSPGRMAPTTAVNFFMIGLAMLLLKSRRLFKVVEALSIATTFSGLIAFIGYAYGVREFYGIAKYTQMALHTSLAFTFLGIGVLAARPERGIVYVVVSNTIGGAIVRRFLPIVVVLPPVLGWLRLKGEGAGIFSAALSTAAMMVIMITLLSTLIIWTGGLLARTDIIRKKKEEETAIAAREWKKTFDSIADPIFIQDREYNIVRANAALLELLKVQPEDVIGKKCYELMHKMDGPWKTCPFDMTKKDGRAHTEEVDDKRMGTTFLITTSPILDDGGKVAGSVHISKDISGRKGMELELKKRLSELEKFQRLTIDRELRMKELKVRIAELERGAKTS